MNHSTAIITTASASRYLQQLCKHFAHKLPVSFDPAQGQIEFSIGTCRLQADETELRLDVTATNPAELPQFKDVVARHLVRFAFREELAIAWRDQETSIE